MCKISARYRAIRFSKCPQNEKLFQLQAAAPEVQEPIDMRLGRQPPELPELPIHKQLWKEVCDVNLKAIIYSVRTIGDVIYA